ncbi:MAG: YkgJ family cysteine cluster protein [Tissierellia bacterium]|nr:YkgJ family cysteine cluster protein [Tissierellia bacterium]
MFRCDMCGECCRNLGKSSIYKEMHDGDGICRYLDGNKCSIYEERPLICRIDDSYEVFFKDEISYENFLHQNYICCEILKNKIREE